MCVYLCVWWYLLHGGVGEQSPSRQPGPQLVNVHPSVLVDVQLREELGPDTLPLRVRPGVLAPGPAPAPAPGPAPVWRTHGPGKDTEDVASLSDHLLHSSPQLLLQLPAAPRCSYQQQDISLSSSLLLPLLLCSILMSMTEKEGSDVQKRSCSRAQQRVTAGCVCVCVRARQKSRKLSLTHTLGAVVRFVFSECCSVLLLGFLCLCCRQ